LRGITAQPPTGIDLNPNGVGEAFFYQPSPAHDVLAIVVFSSENGDPGVGWSAAVSNIPLPSDTCFPNPVPTNPQDTVFNPRGVSSRCKLRHGKYNYIQVKMKNVFCLSRNRNFVLQAVMQITMTIRQHRNFPLGRDNSLNAKTKSFTFHRYRIVNTSVNPSRTLK
jgi:hypothetical protein